MTSADEEIAGCCWRLLQKETENWAFLGDRRRARRGMFSSPDWWSLGTDPGLAAALLTYRDQLIRLCGSAREARQTYQAYVKLAGERGL